MTEKKPLKKISNTPASRATTLTKTDGWHFGIGFFAAGFIFSVVIVPTIFCLVSFLLAILGNFINEFISRLG